MEEPANNEKAIERLAKPTLKENVSIWLAKEGYPLEFATANAFRSRGFAVRQGQYERDAKTGQLREIDVVADINMKCSDSLLRVSTIVECKWSKSKPWAIFTSKSARVAPSACIAQTIASDLGQAILWLLAGDNELQSLRLFWAPDQPGFNVKEVFSDGKDHVYASMQSVVSTARAKAIRGDTRDSQRLHFGEVILPLIVIDGNLFEVCFDTDKGALIVEERSHMRLHWKGAEAWNFHATVDVVTTHGLDDYLKNRKSETIRLLERMSECLGEIKRRVLDNSMNELAITEGARGLIGMPPLLRRLIHEQKESESSQGGSET